MTFAVAVLDQPTAYNGLIHELKQDENQRAIIFGRQNVTWKASINWSEFIWGPPRGSGQEHLLCKKGLRELGWFSLQKGQSWGDLRADPSAYEEVVEKMGIQAHSFFWWIDERLSISWKRRGSAGYKLEHFPHEGSRTLQQITQRLCRVHPVRVSALTGLAQSLEQSGVNPELNLLWAGGQARDLLSSLPMWIFLWSYDLLDFS